MSVFFFVLSISCDKKLLFNVLQFKRVSGCRCSPVFSGSHAKKINNVLLSGLSSCEWIKCLAKGHNTVTLVSLKQANRQTQPNTQLTEPLRSLHTFVNMTCV